MLVGETRSHRTDPIISGGKDLCASTLDRVFGKTGLFLKILSFANLLILKRRTQSNRRVYIDVFSLTILLFVGERGQPGSNLE